jgi:hypothetical protein
MEALHQISDRLKLAVIALFCSDIDVWFVGQNKGDGRMEIQGVFTTRKRAVAACRTPDYFIMRQILNQSVPHETVEVDDPRYPPHEYPLIQRSP